MIRRSHLALLTLLTIVGGVFAVPADAQRTRLYADENKRFEVRVPKWLEPVPAKPGDTQLLAKFQGTRKSTKKPHKGNQSMTVMVFRIPRSTGETTGVTEKEESDEEDKSSLVEQRLSRLNSSRTVSEFLRARGIRGKLARNEKLNKKPLKSPDRRPYECEDGKFGKYVGVRVFVQRDDTEAFGVAITGYAMHPFHSDVKLIVKSLRREPRKDQKDAEDPYLDSDLRDIDKRRQVRDELVHGWTAHDSENYILVTNTKSSKLIKKMLGDLEIMRKAYLERFPPAEQADMDAVSTVRVCHGYDDYLKYAGRRMYGTGGYWNFVEEELVLFNPERKVPRAMAWVKKVDPSAVLYHEAMHQYFHYSNRSLAPGSWFNEGYGEVFGGASLNRSKGVVKSIGKNKSRMTFIKLHKKKKNPPPDLEQMIRMTQRQFYGRSALINYAYSWSFCYFLEQERKKSDRIRNDMWAKLPDKYLAELRKATEAERKNMPEDAPDDWISRKQDPIQKVAIEAALEGVDMRELRKAWEKFVRKL